MKVYRKLITQRALSPIIPTLEKLDAMLLRVMHTRSSAIGIRTLRQATQPEARKMLNAFEDHPVNDRVERQRTRLMTLETPLRPEGPFDKGATASTACAISKSARQAALLAAIVREFAPHSAVELGTNVGISSAYIASSMPAGTLVTLEASEARLALARGVHDNLGLSNVKYVHGLFAHTLDNVLRDLPAVDFAFIDGHHQYQPTLDYFELIAKQSKPGGVFVFDDINWSDGMKQAWAELKADQRFGLVVDFWCMGVGVLRSDDSQRVVTEPITCY